MRSLVAAFVLSLLAATSALADADLTLTIQPFFSGTRVQIGKRVEYWVNVTNNGPGDAHNVRIGAIPSPAARTASITPTDSVVPCPGLECVVSVLQPGQTKSVGIDETFAPELMTVTTTATVRSDDSDPNPENNSASITTEIVEAADLQGYLYADRTAEAEGPQTVTAVIYNSGIIPAKDVVLDVDFPDGTVVTAAHPPAGWTCSFAGARVTCSTPELANSFAALNVTVDVIAPPHYVGGFLTITGRLQSTTIDLDPTSNVFSIPWLFYHLFVVSSTADSGTGSFRQALMDTNAVCGNNCRIDFRIPDEQRERGWFIIRPESPLPSVNSTVMIVGPPGAQPEGHRVNPQVMLDGSRLAFGNGLVFNGINGAGGVSGLAIGNFPEVGLLTLQGGNRLIEDCFIGTMPNGLDAAPNTRGIYAVGQQQLTIRHNVVSGNRRSGITLINQERAQVTQNAIGVGANGVTPVPNGASGIYLGQGADWPFFFNNDIAYNVDFGIALFPGVRRMLASVNAIYGNGQLGIDAGIDLDTPNVEDDKDRVPNHPIINSARFDSATGKTTIEGEMHSNTQAELPYHRRVRVELYADDAPKPQARIFLGTANVTPDGRFTFTVNRDLRGTSVTGIGIRWLKFEFYDEILFGEETSEISPAVKVE